MPKRKREDSEVERKRKIRKLEKRLQRYKESLVENDDRSDLDPEVIVEDVELLEPSPEISQEPPPEISQEESCPEISQEEPPGNDLPEIELPEDVLVALGVESPSSKGYGPKIHPDVLKRIETILVDGLTKEQRETLSKEYRIPENCLMLDAPQLNLEILGILKQSGKSRDKLLQERQQQLGIALANICNAINNMIKDDFNKLDVIKMLSDASRLLGDLHFQYTEIRKKLIAPFIDQTLSLNFKDNKRSEFLYTKLDDTVKSLTTMKRASNILKPKAVPSSSKNSQQRRPGQHHQGKYLQRGGSRSAQQRQLPRAPHAQNKVQDRRSHAAASSNRGRARYP